MTRFLWLFLLGTACDQPARPKGPSGVNDGLELLAYRDESHAVTCYRVQFHEGVSCIHDAPDGGGK